MKDRLEDLLDVFSEVGFFIGAILILVGLVMLGTKLVITLGQWIFA